MRILRFGSEPRFIARAMRTDWERSVRRRRCRAATLTPGPSEVYAALWLGALLVAAGELPDPLPPQIEELARAYFERFPPEVKA